MSVEESVEAKDTEDTNLTDDQQGAEDQGTGTEADEKQGESVEVDVVLTEEAGSPPKQQNLGTRKRVKRLNARNQVSEDAAALATSQLEIANQRIRLLEIAASQKLATEAPKPPDPLDYDDGASDPRYATALRDHTAGIVQAELQKQVTQQQNEAPTGYDPSSERKQEEHYKRADELGVKDYAEVEDAAIEILGAENANHIVQSTGNSQLVLYHLGKNPNKAEYFADLIKSKPVQAVFELGELSGNLVVKPRANMNPAPDPDTELEGGSPASTNAYERKLDKLRESGDIKAIMQFKREERERAT